jgi:hypothetical protein
VSTQTGESPGTPPPRRGTPALGMVGAMGVVLLLIGVVALITLRPDGGDEVRVVDYSDELASARVSAPFEVLAPAGLDGFRATSVRFTSTDAGTVWHLGFVSPLEEYVGLDQSDGPAEPMIDELTEGATAVGGPAGTVELGGRTWARYDEGGDGDGELVRGLVTHEDDTTTLVSGTANWSELEAMASALSSSAGG